MDLTRAPCTRNPRVLGAVFSRANSSVRRDIFTEEHDLFRDGMRTFIEREIVPYAKSWEREGIVDRDLFLRAGEAGLLGISIPEEFGGGGTEDFRFNAIFMEELCRADVMTAGLGIENHMDAVIPYFLRYASDEQKARWLPGLGSGELIGALAMTEPGTGSDLAAISTRAVLDGDHYIINGSKVFISNGINSDLVVVVCRTSDEGPAQRGLSLVVVERGTHGFARGRNLDKLGQHSADTAELFFDDAAVPIENLLGEGGRGFYHLLGMLPQERLSIATTALSHAEVAFENTLEYCKQRQAFGQPIGHFQNSRFQLATMRTELDVTRAFIDAQLSAHVRGELDAEEAAQGKWWCTELSNRILNTCLQLHGGYGYMEECSVGRAWRDARPMTIYGGTNEIMKDIIGRRMLGV
jgi:alkylation response protein AidB-like acyl-CoA dehydrogenase